MNDKSIAALCFLLTVASYFGAKWLYRKKPVIWCSPVLLVPLILLPLMLLADIPFRVYFLDTRWLMWMLGPATVAFALPIYQQRALIARYPLSLIAGVSTSVSLGLLSSWLLAKAFSLSPEAALSLLPRSVSTPFAVSVIEILGGSQELTVLFVMVTGMFGMLAGNGFLHLIRIKTSFARGAALGAAAHGVGTARAYELGQEEGAIASLTMMFSGITLVLLAPWLVPLLK